MNMPYPIAPGGARGPGGPSGPLHPLAFPQPVPPAAPPGITSEQRAELREIWGSIYKRRWFILALVAMASLVAFFVRQSMPPVHRADVSMVLEGNTVRAPGMRDEYSARLPGDYVQTQLAVIRSRAVAERTARSLKLWNHPSVDPRIARPSWYERSLRSLGVDWGPKLSGRQFKDDELTAAAATAILEGLSVNPLRNTYIVNIGFTHENRDVAILVANEIATQYIAIVRTDRSTATSESSKQILDQLVPLREQLAKSEQALLEFTAKRGIVSMGGNAGSPTGQQLGGMTERLLAARADRLGLESAALELRAAGSRGSYLAVPSIVRDPSMADILRQLNTAKAMRTSLLDNFTAESFKVRQADEEIAKLQLTAEAQASVVAQTILSRYEALRQNEGALERAVGGIRGNLQVSNRDEFELTALQTAVERDRKIFETFMSQVKELGVIGEMTPVVARVLDPARDAERTLRGNPNLVPTVAMVTLLLACLGAAYVDRLDNSIKGVTDAEQRLGQHVLAALPVREKAARAQMVRSFVDEPETSYAEGIRTARTGLMLSALDIDRKVILVTSSIPGEGKTTVAINLALAHAQTQPTLLIDCDLRRSRVGNAMRLEKDSKGLTDLVSGEATLEECVQTFEESGLKVLTVGKAAPNPQELLVSQRFQDTIRQLSKEFDVVVIDSPPVELVSDAMVLANLATNIAYVVRAMKTPAPLVRKGIARLRHAGGHVTGLILNRLDFKAARDYHGEYGYGYGSGSQDTVFGSYGYGNGYIRSEKRPAAEAAAPSSAVTVSRARPSWHGQLIGWAKGKIGKR
ncbi:MAG: polysaccharide biosynthesis tyrosine autokinase [Rubrivivax sp.]|nr:polysaccharide biosynthesis tyrosine autokinase [Rubrivivax sp.]